MVSRPSCSSCLMLNWSCQLGVGFNSGSLGSGDDMISPLICRENMNVTIDDMGCLHTLLVLLDKAWYHEPLKMAVEQGGLCASCWD